MTSTDLESTDLELKVGVFSALSDPIRLRILDELVACEQCVCDLQNAIDIAPNLLSYHLRVLREAGLVTATRRGRWVDYALASLVGDLIKQALPDGLARRVSDS